MDYCFINIKNICLYPGLGVGLTVRKGSYTYSDTENSTSSFSVVQVTLLGYRIGDRIALFGELDGGYKGVFQGGIRASL